MDRKEHFLRVLDKILVRADYQVTNESRFNLFITRSKYILKKLGKDRQLNAFNNMVDVYDLKNDIFITINLDDIFSLEHIGLPFEIYPEYLYKPELESKITAEEYYSYQEKAINYVLDLGKRLTKKEFNNNKVLHSSIDNAYIINNINAIIKNNQDNFKYTLDEDDIERFKKLDLSDIEPSFIIMQEELMQNVFIKIMHEFPNLFEYIKYVKVCEFVKMPIKYLDSTDPKVLSDVINIWKENIEERAKKIVTEIVCESETLDDIEKSEDKEEMEYVKNLIVRSISEIDYSVFKTPRQVFHFWPSVLFPIPGFVVHDK